MAPTNPPNPVEAMHNRMLRLHFDLSRSDPAQRSALEETFEAFGITLEELRVAEENLVESNEVLQITRHQLEAERRRYRELFDLAPDGYLVTDAAGVILNANRTVSTLFCVPQKFMEGKILANFVPQAERRAFRLALADADRRPAAIPWRVRLQPRDGTIIDVEVSVSPGTGSHGKGRELFWLIRDLTDRNRPSPAPRSAAETDSAAVVERDRLRDLIDAIGVVVWEADPVTDRLTVVGREIEGLLGRPAGDWLNVPGGWIEQVHPDDRPVLASLRSRQRIERSELELEYRLLAPDGHAIWVREVSRFSPGRERSPESLRGVLININKRKRVERNLSYTRAEAQTQVRELELLQDLSLRLSLSTALPDVLDEILTAVTSVLGAERASLSLYESEGKTYRIAAVVGLANEFPAWMSAAGPCEEPCSRALTQRQSVSIESVEADPDLSAWHDLYQRLGIRSVYAVPLASLSGEPLGVLSAYFDSTHRPSVRQQLLVEHYIRFAGQFLANTLRQTVAITSPPLGNGKVSVGL